MAMIVRQWKTISDDELSLHSISARHQPLSAYRISEYRYEAGAKVDGAMQAATCYVLQGACRITAGESVLIKVGQFVELPRGEYRVEVLNAEPAQLIFAWELPHH